MAKNTASHQKEFSKLSQDNPAVTSSGSHHDMDSEPPEPILPDEDELDEQAPL